MTDAKRKVVRARLAVTLAAVLALVTLAGVVAAPHLDASGSGGGRLLRLAFAPACHQMAERSLDWSGLPMAVCARCTGLYAGGLAGIVLGGLIGFLRSRPRPIWIVWTLAPSVVDFGAGLVGLPSLPNLPRALVAFPAGAVLGIFLAAAITDIVIGSDRPEGGENALTGAAVEESDG